MTAREEIPRMNVIIALPFGIVQACPCAKEIRLIPVPKSVENEK